MSDGANDRLFILGSALIAGTNSVRRDGRDEIIYNEKMHLLDDCENSWGRATIDRCKS